jgi:hypothetical protein
MRKFDKPRVATLVAALVGVLAPRAGSADVVEDELPCPEPLQGMIVSTHPVRGGAQIALKNAGSPHLDELRAFVRVAAQTIEARSHDGLATTASARGEVIPPVAISVDDIGDGAKVTVLADRKNDVDDVRALALVFERIWQASSCGGLQLQTSWSLPPASA